jgi:hypothetical protein
MEGFEMRRLLLLVSSVLFLSNGAIAQDATSIQGTPIVAPPVGFPAPGFQPCPNCSSLDGLSLSYSSGANSGSGGYVINVPHISGGPSSINENHQLIGNQWNWLDWGPLGCSGPPLPVYCYFRTSGFVAYPNGGVWNLRDGILTVAGESNVEYDIQVYVGTYQEPHTGFWLQPDMLNGGPLQDHYQLVGGGGGTCAGPRDTPCQIKFSAHLIYCPANPTGSIPGATGPQACEIRVAVYPKTTSADVWALGLIGPDSGTHQGGVRFGYVSNYYLEQARGL